MIYHEYSYWVTAAPAASCDSNTLENFRGKIATLFGKHELMQPYGPLSVCMGKEDEPGIQACVPDNIGTVPEDTDFLDRLEAAAKDAPWADITARCLDEEDHSIAVYAEFRDGKKILQRYGRVVDPEKGYDPDTVNDICSLLADSGYNATAELIRHHYHMGRKGGNHG